MPGPAKRLIPLDDPEVRTKRKRVRGALRSLPEMPVDIICQIFYLLHPADLLRIARTNKAFRTLLIFRKSDRGSEYACTSIWKESRKNVQGLPEPFPNMSEPAFASLCFESHCSLCFRPGVPDVIWPFRARLCNECKKTKTTTSHTMEVQMGSSTVILKLMVGLCMDRQPLALKSDADRLEKQWGELAEGERETFIKEYEESIVHLKGHVERCISWFLDARRERTNQLQKIREERERNIVDRLEKLGFGPDITWAEHAFGFLKYRLSRLPVVRQPKPLTEHVWQNICPDMINHIMTKIRPLRIQNDYKGILRDRVPLLENAVVGFSRTCRNVFPLLGDFARFPEVRAILDPSNGRHITLENFEILILYLPEMIVRWKDNVEKDWASFLLMQIGFELLDSPVQYSELAITTLVCKECNQVFLHSDHKPAIHRCHAHLFPSRGDRYEITLNELQLQSHSPSLFYVASAEVLKILDACGMDRMTTVRILDDFNPRLVCMMGCDTSGIRTIYSWRDAVVHSVKAHSTAFIPASDPFPYWQEDCMTFELDYLFPYPYGIEDDLYPLSSSILPSTPLPLPPPRPLYLWEVISSEECQKVTQLFKTAEARAKELHDRQLTWYCCHCEEPSMLRNDILSHVKKQHAIQIPYEEDIFPDPDQPVLTAGPVYVVADYYKDSLDSLPDSIQLAVETGSAMFESDLQL